MTPTNELRFVARKVQESQHKMLDGTTRTYYKTIRILQQKWEWRWSRDMGGGIRDEEWRDVPVVKEHTND